MHRDERTFGPHPANDGEPVAGFPSRLPLAVLAAVAVLLGVDIVADMLGWGGLLHLLLEVVMAVVLLGGIVVLWRRYAEERARARALGTQLGALDARLATTNAELSASHAAAAQWREEAKRSVAGLAIAIDNAFAAWGLSPGESEVGFLLVKGLALKEIASLRGTSERTVRDQAGAIYRKSGLAGRAELSAYFLEDLLPSQPST